MSKQYFSCNEEGDVEFHETETQAKERAQAALDYCQDEASSDGWPENTNQICWGELRERVTMTSERQRPDASKLNADMEDESGEDWSHGFDIMQEFELLPIANPET